MKVAVVDIKQTMKKWIALVVGLGLHDFMFIALFGIRKSI
jgi:hypothetical protein